MDSFVIRPTTWPVLRVFSRNPLVRTSDRADAAMIPLAVVLVAVAAVCAGLFGTIVHDVATRNYLEEAKTRHTVVARAVGDSAKGFIPEPTAADVYARWQVNGVDHVDLITWDRPVKAGAPLQIWVDADGNRVDQPTPVALAGADAVLFAAVAWWVVVLATAQTVVVVRAHTARVRDAQWDREIRSLVEDDGGRTNRW
jgi:hypothetical protein